VKQEGVIGAAEERQLSQRSKCYPQPLVEQLGSFSSQYVIHCISETQDQKILLATSLMSCGALGVVKRTVISITNFHTFPSLTRGKIES
jgi:hypothetical protein